MAFFRTISISDPAAVIEGEGVYLRSPLPSDYAAWATLREASRDFLVPWEPAWPLDDLSRAAFRRRLKRYTEEQRNGNSYAFFLFRKQDAAFLGGLTIANVRRGVAQAGSLGYWIGLPYVRNGHMTAAVRATVPFAFSTLQLHRLEAACLPRNAASIALLRACRFEQEGLARQYLCINGRWEDHLLYARVMDRG
jgi:ribosomal-protein-alanine N-acetyltransferase